MFEKHISDGDLLQLLKGDDTAAFETLYNRYWKSLYTRACQRVDADDAKDLVQEVMLSLWRRRQEIPVFKEGEFAKYLHAAIKYRVISHYAFSTAEIKKLALFDVLDSQESTDRLETKELTAKIAAVVAQLPARMQQIFRMSREEDLSIAEIARKLNLSEQTVKNQLTEALRRMRNSLKNSSSGDWAFIVAYIFCHLK
ncbi:RNA polymerase sigma factor [Chitinophaga pinensis]|uniref:Transcriptional regulator, LuxR family n=1 Tax=Chitinophaga pinensis (strain ATCC 43595 / DSM 2588 / LMG 13176 / NBRC 15968 / NCIMB 11800 / UQM 2034) TaxID=485918 RepID=A0A979G939_CHIPD|nr:sigma-70 family RNA polymerase sigma factor [Chitinophaga pinensis]ACU62952.1 transcriptional regulator, LuxR family [Chitinophaga pinensis DSM 2588]